jgi:hypothetical protein
MTTAQLSFELSTSDASVPLAFEAWLDDQCFFQTGHVTETINVTHEFSDEEEKEHLLRLVMNGKNIEHTVLDDNGNITQDAVLNISKMQFDGIELNQILVDNSVYTHDFNGSGKTISDKFFHVMGCNGTVELKFSSPVYIWFLEHT